MFIEKEGIMMIERLISLALIGPIKVIGYCFFVMAVILLTTGCAASGKDITDTEIAEKADDNIRDAKKEPYVGIGAGAAEAEVANIESTEAEVQEEGDEEAEIEEPVSTNVDAFIDGSTFYVDKYAESLGYTTLLNRNNYNSLMIDVAGTHYYISASKTNYNLFYCKGDCTYGIAMADIDSEEKNMQVSSGEKTKAATSTWVHEMARLLEYIATTSPNEVDIESLHLKIRNSGGVYYGLGSFDENGIIDTDSLVPMDVELLWDENVDK